MEVTPIGVGPRRERCTQFSKYSSTQMEHFDRVLGPRTQNSLEPSENYANPKEHKTCLVLNRKATLLSEREDISPVNRKTRCLCEKQVQWLCRARGHIVYVFSINKSTCPPAEPEDKPPLEQEDRSVCSTNARLHVQQGTTVCVTRRRLKVHSC